MFGITCLNAPDGAGCSLTRERRPVEPQARARLNAPDGAGCSLTMTWDATMKNVAGLNAPDGAGCSLTVP